MSKFQAWNFESIENLAKIKKGSVDEEDKFNMEVDENFAAYCTPLIPCIKELRKVVFPEGKRWLREDRQLYSRMKSVRSSAGKKGLRHHFHLYHHSEPNPIRNSSVQYKYSEPSLVQHEYP